MGKTRTKPNTQDRFIPRDRPRGRAMAYDGGTPPNIQLLRQLASDIPHLVTPHSVGRVVLTPDDARNFQAEESGA